MKKIDQEILRVLMAAGSHGLKMEKIARHVYNACNSIFTPLNYKDVHMYVTQYLTRCAKDSKSIIEKGKGYGVYHINYKSTAVEQLMLDFSNTVAADITGTTEKKEEGRTPDLFSEEAFL